MKKKWMIPVAVAAAVLVLLGGALWYMKANTLRFSTGRCIAASNGSCLILLDGFPVQMSNRTGKEEPFADLQTGDEILLLHDAISETYPGGTGAYFCKRLKQGTMDDIPADVIEELSALGWLVMADSGKTREIYTGTVIRCGPANREDGSYQLTLKPDSIGGEEIVLTVVPSTAVQSRDGISAGDRVSLECEMENSGTERQVLSLTELLTVEYEYGYANMRLELPAGWDYEIRAYQEGADAFGIHFWPAEQPDGKLQLEFYPGGFGVCGTGLEEKQVQLKNGLRAFQGTYDGREAWSFLSFRDLPGSYVAWMAGTDAWWDSYGSQAMEIIRSISLADGLLWEDSAIEIAEKECAIGYDTVRADFDYWKGVWSVSFYRADGSGERQTVQITAGGDVLAATCIDPEEVLTAKPVIYLYPEQEREVTVALDFDGTLTTTYPAYKNGWTVIAQPDGTLMDPDTGREYYCLFWEGLIDTRYDFSAGFVVPGKETAAFLEEVLGEVGLTEQEANEFIIYWLPRMEGNAYNLIAFQQEAYTDSARLRITPEPDTVLRVFMAWKALDAPMEIPAQELESAVRTGFTLVEWGGAEIK